MKSVSGWCILRTAGPRTLPLAASLAAAGMEAWTPVEMVKRRVPRRLATSERPAAMMPTFVFVPACHAVELARLTKSPLNPHPPFALFRFDGRVPIVSHGEIEALRLVEQRTVPKRRRRTIAPGTAVRPDSGAYAGMDGVVKSSTGAYSLVAFGGWMNVKIETLLLLGDEVGVGSA